MGWMTTAAKQQRVNGLDETAYVQRIAANFGPDWEVKILRSASGQFADHTHVREAQFQESDADWELVEQIGPRRLLFRRPLSARHYDHLLPPGYTPYREHYQMRSWVMPAMAGSLLLLGLLVALALTAQTL